jgi:DNA-binding transcriptional ArsR family regulator
LRRGPYPVDGNQTVTDRASSLDLIFAALADPTRRAIVARLKQRDASVGQLAQPFEISRPAIASHLDVLSGRGSYIADGRVNRSRFDGGSWREAPALMKEYRSHWEAQLSGLTSYLEREE